jgi:hypothetical protein
MKSSLIALVIFFLSFSVADARIFRRPLLVNRTVEVKINKKVDTKVDVKVNNKTIREKTIERTIRIEAPCINGSCQSR